MLKVNMKLFTLKTFNSNLLSNLTLRELDVARQLPLDKSVLKFQTF